MQQRHSCPRNRRARNGVIDHAARINDNGIDIGYQTLGACGDDDVLNLISIRIPIGRLRADDAPSGG